MSEGVRRIGPWLLAEMLGSGGNSEVYRATRDDGGSYVALKVLNTRRRESERFRRFLAEVEMLSQLGNRSGILPMIDHNTAPDAEHAWMAMPIASLLKQALGEGASPEDVAGAVAAIAKTLASIHDEGIFHRDIKPQNLYSLDGSWVIGDFGLVDYPEKEPLTAEDSKLGPLHFLAPEMLATSTASAGGPADVYSLAKTLWVLVTGKRWPPPGELRVETLGHRMTDFRVHARLGRLDQLVAQATRHVVADRPGMAQFAQELEAWLAPSAAVVPGNDVSDLAAQLRVATEDEFRADETRASLKTEGIALTRQFARTIQEEIGSVITAEGIRGDVTVKSLGQIPGTEPPVPATTKGTVWAEGRWLRVQTPGDKVTLCCGSHLVVLDDRSAYVRAAHLLQRPDGNEILWMKDYVTEAGSIHADRCVRAVTNDLKAEFRCALETFTTVVDEEE